MRKKGGGRGGGKRVGGYTQKNKSHQSTIVEASFRLTLQKQALGNKCTTQTFPADHSGTSNLVFLCVFNAMSQCSTVLKADIPSLTLDREETEKQTETNREIM